MLISYDSGCIWGIFCILLVLLVRDADDVAFDLGRSHCPHDAVRDRGRLSLLYASSYRGHRASFQARAAASAPIDKSSCETRCRSVDLWAASKGGKEAATEIPEVKDDALHEIDA